MNRTLEQIGLEHGTDKAWYHGYCPVYDSYLSPYRHLTDFNFLEIGWGGDGGTLSDTKVGGQSAKMWRDYAPNWKITVIDIIDKTEEAREVDVDFWQGDQGDEAFLTTITPPEGWDCIVDDGSHVTHLTVRSLMALWPHLKPGGWYFIEDLSTAYQPAYGGNPDPQQQEMTHLGVLMALVNDVMLGCKDVPRFDPLLGDVAELRFTQNMVAIRKAF